MYEHIDLLSEEKVQILPTPPFVPEMGHTPVSIVGCQTTTHSRVLSSGFSEREAVFGKKHWPTLL